MFIYGRNIINLLDKALKTGRVRMSISRRDMYILPLDMSNVNCLFSSYEIMHLGGSCLSCTVLFLRTDVE